MVDQQEGTENLTRRELLRRGSLLVATIGAGPAVIAARAHAKTATPLHHVSGTINFYSWQGYDLLRETRAWRKKHGVKFKSTYINTHEDIQAKLTTGGGIGLFNLSTYYAGWGPIYEDLKILTPIDVSKVPNYQKSYPLFNRGPLWRKWWHFEGEQWGIPFTWGTITLNYDAAKIKRPKRWTDLLKPQFKGKIAIMDDLLAAFSIGAKILGFANVDNLYTRKQLDQIMALYRRFKKNARVVAPSYGDLADLFVAGEIVASIPGWAAVNNFAADKGKKTVKDVIPAEGSLSFVDSYFIPPKAKDVDTVLAFIDHTLTPRVQTAQAKSLSAGVVRPDAVPLLEPAVRKLYPYGKINEIFKKAPIFGIPVKPPKGFVDFAEVTEAWTAFKAA